MKVKLAFFGLGVLLAAVIATTAIYAVQPAQALKTKSPPRLHYPTARQAGRMFANAYNRTPPVTTQIVKVPYCKTDRSRPSIYACVFQFAQGSHRVCAVQVFSLVPYRYRQSQRYLLKALKKAQVVAAKYCR